MQTFSTLTFLMPFAPLLIRGFVTPHRKATVIKATEKWIITLYLVNINIQLTNRSKHNQKKFGLFNFSSWST